MSLFSYGEQQGFYGGVGVGKTIYTKYPNYSDGVSVVINGGRTLRDMGLAQLGIEAELTHTFDPVKLDPRVAFHEIKVMTLGLYGVYRYYLSDAVYARAKLGLVNYDYEWDYGTGHTHERDVNSLGVAFGGGIGVELGNMHLYGDYLFVDGSDLKQFNVGLQKAF